LGTVRFRQGNWIYSLDLSPDGRKLITVGGNNHLHLWDMATGKEIHQLPEEKRSTITYAAAFSPDGRTFATGGWAGHRHLGPRPGAVGRGFRRKDRSIGKSKRRARK
jgi:WD40 repeat protein